MYPRNGQFPFLDGSFRLCSAVPLPATPDRFVTSRRERLGIEPLPFDERHAAHDVLLPAHHRDPFDCGLVSQAILHGMTIVTPDATIAMYPAPVLWL